MHSLETIKRINEKAVQQWQQKDIQFPEPEKAQSNDSKVLPAIETAMELSRHEDQDLFALLKVAFNLAQGKAAA